jgi:SnoaL-like domain
MTQTVSDLMEANLLGVFNERDAQRRASAIESTYTPGVRWTDDEGTTIGREALEAKARALQSQMRGLVFTKASPVYQTRGFGYMAWKLGPEGGDAVAAGFDAAIVRDDLIAELYTVVTSETDGQPDAG